MHQYGEFSIAAFQRSPDETSCVHVESARTITYIGVSEVNEPTESRSISISMDNLFHKFLADGVVAGEGCSTDLIVKKAEIFNQLVAEFGVSCLMGYISCDRLWVANVGGARAVIGRRVYDSNNFVGHQLILKNFAPRAPHVNFYNIQVEDKFLIIGSSSVWSNLSDNDAIDIIKSNDRENGAKRLAIEALKKNEKSFPSCHPISECWKVPSIGDRHEFSDLVVVVLYFDNEPKNRKRRLFVNNVTNKAMKITSGSVAENKELKHAMDAVAEITEIADPMIIG